MRAWTEHRDRRDLKRQLQAVKFERSWAARYNVWVFIAVTTVATGALVYVASTSEQKFFADREGLLSALVTGILGLAALSLGLQQWRGQRNEVSLDKFYERLATTNGQLAAWKAARPFALSDDAQLDCQEFERRMYVYLELDNLEYGIAKYRMGHMSVENAHRCLRTFEARCVNSAEFGDLAKRQVGAGTGYARETQEVVRALVDSNRDRATARPEREARRMVDVSDQRQMAADGSGSGQRKRDSGSD